MEKYILKTRNNGFNTVNIKANSIIEFVAHQSASATGSWGGHSEAITSSIAIENGEYDATELCFLLLNAVKFQKNFHGAAMHVEVLNSENLEFSSDTISCGYAHVNLCTNITHNKFVHIKSKEEAINWLPLLNGAQKGRLMKALYKVFN